MPFTILSKKTSPGALVLKVVDKKFDAIRYLPKLARAVLRFNAKGELVAETLDGIQSLSGAGAIDTVNPITKLTTTGASQALTLADGYDGQRKEIIHAVDGGSAILTPTTKSGFTTITFTNVGETAVLRFLTGIGWHIISIRGAVAA